ncbi:MAG TPA: hypothetical protein VJW73_21390, partial [Gemmatimonadaceae bacterium]|nr:hypothetical protein [Gemmatimonadaceae bacterium]
GGSTHSTTVGASLGARFGPFLSIAGGSLRVDNLLNNASLFNVTAAITTLPLASPETELCPFVSVSVINGFDLLAGEGGWWRTYGAGLGVGTTISAGDGFAAVPFASAALVLPTAAIVHSGPEFPLGWTDENYLAASLGIGFTFGQSFTVRPTASFLTHGRTTGSLGLHVSYAFGHVTVPPPPRAGDGSLASVWVNPRAMVYYCSGSPSFGNTSGGEFMTEREAIAAGYRGDHGKRC